MRRALSSSGSGVEEVPVDPSLRFLVVVAGSLPAVVAPLPSPVVFLAVVALKVVVFAFGLANILSSTPPLLWLYNISFRGVVAVRLGFGVAYRGWWGSQTTLVGPGVRVERW